MTEGPAAQAARYNVRPLLPGPESALRDAVLRMGAGPGTLPALARYAAAEAFAVSGLGADQARVLERELQRLGGAVVSSEDGTRAVLLGPLSAFGELPSRLVEWGRRTEGLGAALQEALAGKGSHPPPVPCGARTLHMGRRTLVMGIVNTTPDSFSGDGLGGDVDAAVALGVEMVEAGADLLDVGGESTRPHSEPVPEQVELERVLPVLRALVSRVDVPISVDTRKASVARAAIDTGASVVNDVWGLLGDPAMAAVVAASDAALVVMHNRRGQGEDGEDVVEVVAAGLRRSLAAAEAAGIPPERVVVDPGVGFGKTPAQNLEVMRRLGELRGTGRALLVGASRKSTIGMLLDGAPPDQRLDGSLAMAVLAAASGADMVRVHDVAETVRALRVADAVLRGTPDHLLSAPAPGPTG